MAQSTTAAENVAKEGTITEGRYFLAWVVEAIWRAISKRKLEVKASET